MKKKPNHIMLDLETMGKKPGCAIVQISAVVFDLDGNTYDQFNQRIDLESNTKNGLEIDASTVQWWMTQEKDAQNIVFNSKEKTNIKYALSLFTTWMNHIRGKFVNPTRDLFANHDEYGDMNIWGNGATFDNVILETAFEKVGYKSPFRYYEHRDVRTITMLDDEYLQRGYKQTTEFKGIKHNAIDDCKFQIKYMTDILKHFTNIG